MLFDLLLKNTVKTMVGKLHHECYVNRFDLLLNKHTVKTMVGPVLAERLAGQTAQLADQLLLWMAC